MEKYRKVSYSLPEETITEIEIIQLMKSTEQIKISKSEIVENALLYSFDIFEEELRAVDNIIYIPINFKKTIIQTYTISVDVLNKLNYYASELGIKKSHLVLAG
ncbi:MAG: hypothetical protein U9Q29_08110, partial [Campylobacterota bacterium]|nr:hypothetical protein [Campylobacterota bacterium]